MTRSAARQELDAHEAAIARNVEDFFTHRITYEEFDARQREHHDAIAAAGQTDHFFRRWRHGTPAVPGA